MRQRRKTLDKKEFVVTHSGEYVGFHSTNLKHPIRGYAKDGVVDCARMLAEEYGTNNIRIAANVKDIFKYGIEFRDLTPRDQIYVNKIQYMINQETKQSNLNVLKVRANVKEQNR